MRRSIFVSLLITLLLGGRNAWAEPPSEPDLIFLLIGQSNMAGRAALEAGDEQPLPGILLLTDKGTWEPARHPLNRYASNRKDLGMQRISPGDGFAREIHRRMPEAVIGLISNARGGTSIQEWEKGKPLYDNTMKRLKNIPADKLAGVLWHQGEANAKDADYLRKLSEFIATLRKDLNRPDLPFVAGQVFGDRPVNEQIAKLPDTVPNTAFASAEGLAVFDGVHFDRESQRTLGQRYAEAMSQLIQKP